LDYDSTRKICTFYNKRVISKKLVTIFARHLDSYIVTQNLSSVYQFLKTGSGQILQPRQLTLSPGLAKIAPWWLAHRDSFLAKVPGLETAGCATTAFCSYPLAVSCKANRKSSFYLDFRRARKSFAARPCNHPFAAKHMLFCLPGLRRLDNFIIT
jgi:hypothetical protein